MFTTGWRRSKRLAIWFACGLCLTVALVGGLGWRAVRELEQSSKLLVQKRVDEGAHLLVTALTRDMRGAQELILSSRSWDDWSSDAPHEAFSLVASAFARYPYPEAFFAWDSAGSDSEFTFFVRAERNPAWAPLPENGRARYPVRLVAHPGLSGQIRSIVDADGALGHPFSLSEVAIASRMYQLVVQLQYSDPLRQRLVSARGFLVDLDWARQHYFNSITAEIGDINGNGSGLALGILDGRGRLIAGEAPPANGELVTRRSFPLAFFDPALTESGGARTVPERWSAFASGTHDPWLTGLLRGASLTLMVAMLSALVFAAGMWIAVNATQSARELAEIRAEFMSSITHELKTPIAIIRAMAETLAKGKLAGVAEQQEYATDVVQETKRLTRLVDNVLAHSRLTDVADVYAFEPQDVEDLLASALAAFRHPLERDGFTVTVKVPPDLPPIMADHTAMELLLDNLIDNAIRHSTEHKALNLTVTELAEKVCIEIADRGCGIAESDLERITQKFVRGRNAAPGGSGLGLSIVSRIVHDHRGTLSIVSTLGRGTIVRVTLPSAAHSAVMLPHPDYGHAEG